VSDDGSTALGIPNPATAPPDLFSNQDLLTQGRNLATSSIPLQLGGLFEALAALRSKAAGSPSTILPGVISQLGGLRNTYAQASQALARRLGPSGGGQLQRGQQGLLTQATRQYAGLLGTGQQEGFTGLLNTTGGLQPTLSGAARPPNIGERQSPFDPAVAQLQGQGLASMLNLAATLGKRPATPASGLETTWP